MTWALAAQLAGAFFLGALWMYRRQRRQIRLIATFLARANAELADDLFDHLLHDDPDDDFTGQLDAAAGQTRPDHAYRAWMN